jgi:hypothetical protein
VGEGTPILARCHAGVNAKGSGKIGLRRKTQCDGNIEHRLIPQYQPLLGALETLRTDVLMRRLSHCGFECSRKVELAQRCDFRQLGDRKIPRLTASVSASSLPPAVGARSSDTIA